MTQRYWEDDTRKREVRPAGWDQDAEYLSMSDAEAQRQLDALTYQGFYFDGTKWVKYND